MTTVPVTPDLPRSGAKLGTKRSIKSLIALASLLGGCAATALAQPPTPPPTTVISPPSSTPAAASAGVRVHTHLQMLGAKFTGTPNLNGPPFGPGLFYETPASVACIYALQPPVAGCNPYIANLNPTGGGKAIAVVDAYHNPNALADLQTFDSQFGIAPPPNFIVIYAPRGGATLGTCDPGSRVNPPQPPPAAGTGWDIEASLDVQWAHAMAPNAILYLIEAQSNSLADLMCAVIVSGAGIGSSTGGQISMSWGASEFSGETALDSVFNAPQVVFFASTGDAPGTQYPSVSPNVVAVGGTTLSRNPITGNFIFENSWQSTGDGISQFEKRPAYQNGINTIVGDHRGVPDVAADANPSTGVWVFNSSFIGLPVWFIVGGTSAASPIWAGITNAAGSFSPSSTAQLTKLYSAASGFTDITVGVCGPFQGYVAAPGWDLCSGLGSPYTYSGK